MAYTPSNSFSFSFSASSYTPSGTFAFAQDAAVSGQFAATLDDVVGSFAGNTFVRSGQFAAMLDDATGTFSGNCFVCSGQFAATLDDVAGSFAGNAFVRSGEFAATLEDVSGQIVGAVVPQGQLSAVLDDVVGDFVGKNYAVVGGFNATLDDAGGGFAGNYKANVVRLTVSSRRSDQQSAAPVSTSTAFLQQQATTIQHAVNDNLNTATPAGRQTQLVYQQTTPIAAERRCVTGNATPLGNAVTSVQDLLQWLVKTWRAAAEQTTPVDAGTLSPLQQMTKIHPPAWCMPVQDMSDALTDFYKVVAGEPEEPWRYTPTADFAFSPGNYTPTADFVWPNVVPFITLAMRHIRGIDGVSVTAPRQKADQAKINRCVPVDAAQRPPPGKSVPIDPPRPPYEPPTNQNPVTIPTQTVYIMQHTLSVKTVPGNLDVPVSRVGLSYDADSFAWQFSADLLTPSALSMVSGGSAELAVEIDGYQWRVLVETVERSVQFAKNTITLKGRSKTALLGAPSVLPASATMGSDLTVQQIADQLMPLGWTIVWNAPTWLVPGGAYSYTNQTPIQALAALVADIGCVAVPHAVNQTITVQPRYPVYPWQFDSATPDLIIPEAAITGVTLRPAPITQANGVYVHGGDIGGVLAWCRLNGTAGDRLAPTVSNALMTDVIACRLLGERILAGQWQQPLVKSATLPLDGVTFPLASVGQLVDITLDGNPVRGIVNSVSIEASLGSASQTIQIGEETANIWTTFTSLLPRDPLLVSTIASTDGATSVITLLDGGVVSVRGTGTAGDKVYIRAGRIEGAAPAMIQNEIVV